MMGRSKLCRDSFNKQIPTAYVCQALKQGLTTKRGMRESLKSGPFFLVRRINYNSGQVGR